MTKGAPTAASWSADREAANIVAEQLTNPRPQPPSGTSPVFEAEDELERLRR